MRIGLQASSRGPRNSAMAIKASNCTGPPLNTTAGGDRKVHPPLQPVDERFVGRVVEHHTDGALAAVLHHVHDRAVEVRVVEGRSRQQQHAPGRGVHGMHATILALKQA